jgi:hypothetical protein
LRTAEEQIAERAAFLESQDAVRLIEEYHGPWLPDGRSPFERVKAPGDRSGRTVNRAVLESHERYLNRCMVEADMQLEARKRRGPACRNTASRQSLANGKVRAKR